MHSLKPSGDNIAQEFLRILGNQSLVKSAFDLGEGETDGETTGDETEGKVVGDSGVPDDEGFDFLAELQKQLDQSVDVGDHAKGLLSSVDFEEMITDEGQFDVSEAGAQLDAMDAALDSFSHTQPEKRVLVGLSKIAGSLRAKGEAFAADVVEATAISIQGDLKKEAGRKSEVISGLKKLASEFYNSGDSLAGDMVAVTINKLAQSRQDMFDQLNERTEDEAYQGSEEAKPAEEAKPTPSSSPWDDMNKRIREKNKPVDKSLWPENKAGIPAAVASIKKEVAALVKPQKPAKTGDKRKDREASKQYLKAKGDAEDKQIEIYGKHGFIEQLNNVWHFNLKGGGSTSATVS